mgnify:CR=1 FL=1|tara:strand:+ start:9 stop:1046 length:1038 start_codon:yes stop_codon:yes gene_type:complete
MAAPILAGIGKMFAGAVSGTARGIAMGARATATTTKSSGRLVQSASNVKSNIIKSNKKIRRIKLNRKRIKRSIFNEQQRKAREKRIESGKRKQGIGSNILSSNPVSSLKKLLFTILGGMIISNLPVLIKTFENIKKGFDNFAKFISTTKKGFDSLVDTFVLDDMELEKLKSKVEKGLKEITQNLVDPANLLKTFMPDLGFLRKKNTDWFDEEGLIDPITHAGKHDGALNEEGTGPERLSDTFDSYDEKEIEALKKEWKELYFVDMSGTVRHKDTGKRAIGARFMGLGTGIDFEDIKNMLDKRPNPFNKNNISPIIKDNSSLNKSGDENTVIINNTVIQEKVVVAP